MNSCHLSLCHRNETAAATDMNQYILRLPSHALLLQCWTPKTFHINKHIGNVDVNILFLNLFTNRSEKVQTISVSHHRIQLRLTAFLRNKMYTEQN